LACVAGGVGGGGGGGGMGTLMPDPGPPGLEPSNVPLVSCAKATGMAMAVANIRAAAIVFAFIFRSPKKTTGKIGKCSSAFRNSTAIDRSVDLTADGGNGSRCGIWRRRRWRRRVLHRARAGIHGVGIGHGRRTGADGDNRSHGNQERSFDTHLVLDSIE
jgi:hypothetical protein